MRLNPFRLVRSKKKFLEELSELINTKLLKETLVVTINDGDDVVINKKPIIVVEKNFLKKLF